MERVFSAADVLEAVDNRGRNGVGGQDRATGPGVAAGAFDTATIVRRRVRRC